MKRELDWNDYLDAARQVIREGCILLENRKEVLPLEEGTKVALFGRIQNHYYKSGLGSGGMVNVSKITGVYDALKESGRVILNEDVEKAYADFEEKSPFNEGEGWGQEPWSQVEMELPLGLAIEAGKQSDVAIVIIGRTAGEDKDLADEPGSFKLTDIEMDLLSKVRLAFSKVVLLLNTASLMDLSFMKDKRMAPDALMLIWTGGMIGGSGVVDLLMGDASPSGHLTDTISEAVSDHYSDLHFGDKVRDFYEEDIYVGYRYFETFAKDKVLYPFGYGLSYTSFSYEASEPVFSKTGDLTVNGAYSHNRSDLAVTVSVNTTNSGNRPGQGVAQIYIEAPNGKLGKASRVLGACHKTGILAAGASEQVEITIPARNFASYDDSGVTGHDACFVLEEGTYNFYVGGDVRSAQKCGSLILNELVVIEELREALRPVEPFKRLHRSDKNTPVLENVPLARVDMDERRKEEIPEELTTIVDTENIPLSARYEEAEDIVARLTDEELTCLVRGEGMGSSKVTPGTACAFAGVSESLIKRAGIPSVCCSDGPSGMRIDCGIKAFSLPSGQMIAACYNPALVARLYECTGLEMITNKIDCLLGPGMNIHRHPLNGRNFEYFSEDPYVTGITAEAMVAGLQAGGTTGVMKHFAANNQEYRRHFIDSAVSERALREIYLKGFEMVVRDGYGDAIMTTYGMLNGLYTAGNYDLNTEILRGQWGFTGIVMTDWWASINERGKDFNKTNFGAMVRAQNDMYMVCPDGSTNRSGDNIWEAFEKGLVTRAELQRTALNVISFALKTPAMKRMRGEEVDVTIVNRPKEDMDVQMEDVSFITLDGDLTIPLDTKESKSGTSYILPFDIEKPGTYEIIVRGSSDLGELAQLPVTLFYTSFPLMVFTFHGTEGAQMEITKKSAFTERFAVMRLYVARNGLKLKDIRFRFLHEGGRMGFLENPDS